MKSDESFNKWWYANGRMYDPDTEDVDWYTKRKELAAYAFEAGVEIGIARSRNYIASDEVMPETVVFANGRLVKIVSNDQPGVHNGVYLDVGYAQDLESNLEPVLETK